MPRIQLLVVQPTPFCNIDCRYCYLPQRSSKAVIAAATLANLFSQVFASGWAQDALSVVWHAGEPMVLPIDFYRQAFRMIDDMRPPDLMLTHSFQTNGTLIDDAWCDFFAEANINVGVSIDGPQRLHAGEAYKGVRVRASANALELDHLPGNVSTKIKVNDCTHCIGKKFVENGGGGDGVRAEDLPRHFRVIMPTHGVAGIVHNPNRLDLILDANHTIVMAFWE